MALRLLILTGILSTAFGVQLNNGTAIGSTILQPKERFRRLIPYMTFYLGQPGNQQYRPAVPLQGKETYLPYQQQQQQQPYALPLIASQYARPVNYVPRYVVQQSSPLTKMITQNYLAISKPAGGQHLQTRLNLYPSQQYSQPEQQYKSPQPQPFTPQEAQYKPQPQELPLYKPQLEDLQYNQPTDEPIQVQYKQHLQEVPVQYKQQLQEVPVQLVQNVPLQYKQTDNVPVQYKQKLQEPAAQIQAVPFKASHQLTDPIEYQPIPEYKHQNHEQYNQEEQYNQQVEDIDYKTQKEQIAVQIKPQIHHTVNYKQEPKQVYIVRPQYQPQTSQDSVTITQSQEIEVQPLSQPKYHATYQAKSHLANNPISYQEQEEYVKDLDYPIENNFNNILDGVSISKSLPDRITPENLDSSIKTLSKLLRILQRANALPQSAKEIVKTFPKPVEPGYSTKVKKVHKKLPPKDDEGGTPGKAGFDYPAYDEIPHTAFSCKSQRYKGFFGDPDTGCQVWHYCDLNGGQASFLCPNGTIFSQVALTCDWWFNVKCDSTTQLYVLNERLYKYILPHKPSFPEDYSGPLVDHYLTLKFKEIEEKNKNKTENASKEESSEEEEEEELPYSLDVASDNKVRSISH